MQTVSVFQPLKNGRRTSRYFGLGVFFFLDFTALAIFFADFFLAGFLPPSYAQRPLPPASPQAG